MGVPKQGLVETGAGLGPRAFGFAFWAWALDRGLWASGFGPRASGLASQVSRVSGFKLPAERFRRHTGSTVRMSRNRRTTKRRIGEILVAEKLLTDADVNRAHAEQKRLKDYLVPTLVHLGLLTEEQIARAFMSQLNAPFLDLGFVTINEQVLNIFPLRMLQEYQFVPIDTFSGILLIASASLINPDQVSELEMIARMKVMTYITSLSSFRKVLTEKFTQTDGQADQLSNLGAMLLADS